MGSPEAEFTIDTTLVRRLLVEQHPDFAHLPIRLLDSGWDNVIFRLGDRLCVRLPRRTASAALIKHEQAWLSRLATQLPIAIPVPLRTGSANGYFPWSWSIVPWIEGTSADQAALLPSQAGALGRFLGALHRQVPTGAPHNPYRGIPLTERARDMEDRLGRLIPILGQNRHSLQHTWEATLAATIDTPPALLHGDLHPQNIVVHDGIIAGILDWGDICVGDAATDLAALWMLFGDSALYASFWEAYGPASPSTLRRAEGWALMFGAILLDTGLINNPRHARLGRNILENVLQTTL